MVSVTDETTKTEPVDTTGLDIAFVRLKGLEQRLRWVTRVLILSLALLFITTTGWWLTSNDHTATERNGRVGDCRSLEFAQRIDNLTAFVSSKTPEDVREAADEQLSGVGTLEAAYETCIAAG